MLQIIVAPNKSKIMFNATLCWLSVKATFINAKKAIFNPDHLLPFHSNPNIGQGCRT